MPPRTAPTRAEDEEGGPETDRPMTLGEHLEELRRRVFRAVIYVAAATILAFTFDDWLVSFIATPYAAVLAKIPKAGLQVTEVSELFMARMWLDIVVGLFVAGPFVLLEIWGFVAKGLYDREKRWVRVFAPISLALFVGGCAFYYLLIQPFTLEQLLTYGNKVPLLGTDEFLDIAVQIRLESAIRLYLVMSLVMGLTFQLPVGMVFAQKIGLVTWRTYSKYRRHFLVVNLVAMAILTPTADAITLGVCMIPVVILFEGGILVCRLLQPDVPKEEEPQEA